MTADDIRHVMGKHADRTLAAGAAQFFKTGPGEYGEGDVFIGIRVPTLRTIVKDFRGLPLAEIKSLLHSPIHEERSIALMILVYQFGKGDSAGKTAAFDFYLANVSRVNNWDLVDLSAPSIVGAYLVDKNRKLLGTFAKSKNLWERRIAIVATQHFIRHDDYVDTLKIGRVLLRDEEDLIHKAVGWMLREVGQRHEPTLEEFLTKHAADMPRTMLRYAIERMDEAKRRGFMGMS